MIYFAGFILWLVLCGHMYLPSELCVSSNFASTSQFFFPIVIFVIGLILSVSVAFFKRKNANWPWFFGRMIAMPIVFVIFLLATVFTSLAFRNWALKKIPGRAEPLIAAIGQYQKTHGDYPADLNQAGVLDTGTGICAYPNFEYELDQVTGYALTVSVPRGGANFAEYSYHPKKGWTYFSD